MKVLLISPNIKGVKGGINRIQPPMGIGYIASFSRQAGHDVFIRDTALEGYDNHTEIGNNIIMIGENDEQIKAFIKKINPDVVGVTASLSSLESSALNVIKLAKDVNPNIITVLGGNHITFSNKDFGPDLDYIVKGEGEIAFVDLLDRINKNIKSERIIRGLPFQDMDKLPLSARDIMNMEGYFKINLFHSSRSNRRVLNVMTSRGCPENCCFCTTPKMWGRSVRFRNAKNVFDEIKECIEKYGIEEVQFEDDTLTLNIQNLYKLCELITPLKIKWCVPNGIRINYHVDKQEEIFDLMKKSGCYQVTFACESGSQRVLDEIVHKNLKLEQMKPAIEKAKRAGLLVHTFWVVGLAGETRSEMEQTIKFASTINSDSFSVSILCPLPGSKIYDIVSKDCLWWDNNDIDQMIYRKSLYRVDGFKTAEEFEDWVNKQNALLNKGNKILIKQT